MFPTGLFPSPGALLPPFLARPAHPKNGDRVAYTLTWEARQALQTSPREVSSHVYSMGLAY